MGSQITPEKFTETLQLVYEGSIPVARNHGWCCQWLDVFTRLSRCYTVHHVPDGYCGGRNYRGCAINIIDLPLLDMSWFRPGKFQLSQDKTYAGELRLIRGRIIGLHENAGRIFREEMVSVLTRAGLDPVYDYSEDWIPLLTSK